MPTNLTNSSFQRSFSNLISHDGAISIRDAVNYSNNKIVNYFIRLLNYCNIEEKQQDLSEQNEISIAESVLMEKPDSRGYYSCSFSLGNKIFVVSDVRKRGVNLVTNSGLYPVSSRENNNSRFVDLKRVMLIRYLAICNKSGKLPNVNQFDLQGVDLSGLDLSGLDLSNADMSRTVCRGTNFSGAKLTGTNFTDAIFGNTILDWAEITGTNFAGVDLIKSNSSVKYVMGGPVIVSEEDRVPYVELFKNRLSFIFTGEKIGDDLFYSLPSDNIDEIHQSMTLDLTEDDLNKGVNLPDNGFQSIVLRGEFDHRMVNDETTENEQNRCIIDAKEKLLGKGFTADQKRLFHYARFAAWNVQRFNFQMCLHNLLSDTDFAEKQMLYQTYIQGEKSGPQFTSGMLKACFDIVLLEMKKDKFPSISDAEVAEVRELFESPKYRW